MTVLAAARRVRALSSALHEAGFRVLIDHTGSNS